MASRSFCPRYVMIGGFLGAGKTTAVLRLAEHLDRRGCRVGLITNDQSVGLVDTTLLSARGFPVEEITGGCFCCRFDSLLAALHGTLGEAAAVGLRAHVQQIEHLRPGQPTPTHRLLPA